MAKMSGFSDILFNAFPNVEMICFVIARPSSSCTLVRNCINNTLSGRRMANPSTHVVRGIDFASCPTRSISSSLSGSNVIISFNVGLTAVGGQLFYCLGVGNIPVH